MKEDIDILFKNWRNIPIVSSQLFMQDFPYLTSPWDHWNKVVDVLKNSQDSPIHIDENDENDDNHNENDDHHKENDDHHKENDDHHKENDENDENVDNKSDSSEEKENQKENQKNNQNVDWVQSDDEL